ncbi:flagellar basal body rod protein FlgB [Caldichromatium japonicum]|uniref:Flagellar basal body rod protein FlgB n=1 Tax=Caldichromatium japonicum TaxID=2699430 RepID=A0A6G7VD85_9GAMM|nr:flagellar basal body rod protein FlgB [Caldichromatium japonicum]QIK37981.1 flagellar basal body rod protein FlgB [Caldichromatium japonicum]
MSSLSLDKAFGVLPSAVLIKARRAELLASNLANIDTPNYKARDFHFTRVLAEAEDLINRMELTTTDPSHLTNKPDKEKALKPELLYRIPAQPSLDGNTVDPQLERAAFAENTMHYQSTLEFLDRRVGSLRAALRKE